MKAPTKLASNLKNSIGPSVSVEKELVSNKTFKKKRPFFGKKK